MKEMKNRTFFICLTAILVIFGLLMCWGCSRKETAQEQSPADVSAALSQPFDAKATIKLKDLNMTADINRTAAGCATIKINEPKSLSGMTFAYDGADIKVSYMGFTVKLDENSKLVSSVASVLVNAIDKAASPSGVKVKVEDDALMVSGECDSGKFSMRMDKKDGSVGALSFPELDFECRFDDFIFHKQG